MATLAVVFYLLIHQKPYLRNHYRLTIDLFDPQYRHLVCLNYIRFFKKIRKIEKKNSKTLKKYLPYEFSESDRKSCNRPKSSEFREETSGLFIVLIFLRGFLTFLKGFLIPKNPGRPLGIGMLSYFSEGLSRGQSQYLLLY